MNTETIVIRSDADFPHLERAGEILRTSGLVAFPTETVYGLGGNALDKTASKKIYAAKGRPSDNPLIVHIATPEEAEKYCITNKLYYELASSFMPGPLTIILPKKYIDGIPVIPDETTGGLDSVAIRCPADPIAHKLIVYADVPIAAPSANTSGSPSPTSATHVIHDLNNKIDMIIDGGESVFGLESTVIRIDGDTIYLLRPGAVTAEQLSIFANKLVIADEHLKEGEQPLSPGMKYKHYAPSKPLYLVSGDEELVLDFFKEKQKEENCAIICYDEDAKFLNPDNLFLLGKQRDLLSHAHRLFDFLRKTDVTDTSVIYARLPSKEGIGLALYNRLIRAAGHNIINLK
ncbi:MAG: threonylcarbamoyl-AMP synthase [Clostridia bacterium]|nr:threonylcarbamoyl-AMP synthase [Clostridia bacterium]